MLSQPVARIDAVRDTYFGTTIEDPYRWMEEWQSEESVAWLKEQAAYTKAYFAALPERASFLARVTELSQAGPRIRSLSIAGGHVFYMRLDPGENLPKLMMRPHAGETERVLLDTNSFEGKAQTAIDWYYPSPNGQYVAYGLSQGGSEDSTLYVLEVESGKTLDDAIPGTQMPFLSWLADNQSFVYHRYPQRAADTPETDYYLDGTTYLHRLGTHVHDDPIIFGREVSSGTAIARQDNPYVVVSAQSEWVIGVVQHGDMNELSLYTTTGSTLFNAPDTTVWSKIADIDDEVTSFGFIGETIYLRTHKDASRYKVIRTSLPAPDLVQAMVLVPESEVVVEHIKIAGDYLLINDLNAGIGELRRVKLSGGEPEPVALPVKGTVMELVNEAAGADVLIEVTSWITSSRIYRFTMTEPVLHDTGWYPPSTIDVSAFEAYQVHYTARDGVQVPLSLIHKKGLQRDGSNPTILTGYGSYGISSNPYFNPMLLAWLERGGVLAVAHIRGGGEYGDQWHKAGQKLNKFNTINDFIDAAEYLIAEQYTRPQRLAGQGGSAGGIPTSGAVVRRPDLWSVMVMQVPVVNGLRSELTANGPPNIPEFGTVTTEDGFKGLQITDAYTKIQAGTNYPAVLLTAGFNDPRVVVWQAGKMAARLQAATASEKPVLLRVEFQGGHGIGSTQQQFNEETADTFALLWQQMGM